MHYPEAKIRAAILGLLTEKQWQALARFTARMPVINGKGGADQVVFHDVWVME
jgi:peptide subunit release factor 1 (eRF1)